MSARNILLLTALLLLVASCRHSSQKGKDVLVIKEPPLERLSRAETDSIELLTDSLRIDSALSAAFQLARQNDQEIFTDSLFIFYDSATYLSLHLSVDRFFSPKFRHMGWQYSIMGMLEIRSIIFTGSIKKSQCWC